LHPNIPYKRKPSRKLCREVEMDAIMESKQFAFGHWPSPVTGASVAEGALRFGRVQAEGDSIYWSEGRPGERGRAPVMCWSKEGGISELLPAPYSARSRVHEYGGGEFLAAGGRLFFVNDADQDVYAKDLAAGEGADGIQRLTSLPETRFADFAWDKLRQRLLAVGETHGPNHGALPRNSLWAIPAGESAATASPLLEGHDFYASPRLSPDGRRLAFLAWDLPTMPWDAAQLFAVELAEDGRAGEPISIAGGNGSACFQPEWAPDGTLYFVWDADGSGQLYAWREGSAPKKAVDLDADLSMPQWSFNAASFALLPGGRAYCTYVRNGEAGAAIAGLGEANLAPRETGFSAVHAISASGAGVVLEGLKDDEALCIALDDPASVASPAVLRRSTAVAIDAAYVSRPSRLEIPSSAGTVHGLLYPPQNPAAHGPAGAPPPLVISLHGGPTSAAARGLKPRTLYFTSRGFAWLDLDYAGSVSYGRAYRERLRGNWGIADVADTIAAARFTAGAGIADPGAIFVTGGSAGGYTLLMAIATASVFRGAASYYGVCDLVALQKTTHKFEQGYQLALLGAPLEENEAVYRERSPIQHIDRMSTPLILFQGAEDNVVHKGQSIAIAEALRAKGVPVEYHEFAGEGHGFRQADTIRTCLERELAFYLGLMAEPGAA
jgi:dipeptidyl aminopeptidase/acylaminoacyl peptidase